MTLILKEAQWFFGAFGGENGVNDFVASANATKTIYSDIDKKHGYDVIIIDSGGRDTAVMRLAIMAARYGMLIIPFMASQFDFSALIDTLQVLAEARALDPDIEAYVLYNRLDERKKITREAREDLEELERDYNFNVLTSALGSRNDYVISIAQGQGAIEYKSRDNKAKNEIEELYKEVKKILGIKKGAAK